MANPGAQAPAASRGITILEQSEEDKASGMFTVTISDNVRARLTARQLQILSMPPDQRRHVPQIELVELGKIMMEAQEGRIDDMFEAMDRTRVPVPEYIDEPYEYEPLKKETSLRLIRLLPETEEGLVQISLEEYDLEEHIPHYYCLSYCWGNPHAQTPLFDYFEENAQEYTSDSLFPLACDGKTLYVHKNLYDALQQLPDAPGLQRKQPFLFMDRTEMFTDLHVSVVQQNMSLVKTNLFRGAEVDCKDDSGRTALTLAVIVGNIAISQVLLEAGANPQEPDYADKSPLDYALALGKHEIADSLLNYDGSNPKFRDRRNKHRGHGSNIWIDAICINQADIDERSVQVRVMDRIYAQASFITVWLGAEDAFEGLARSTIGKLFPAAASIALGESNIIPFRGEPTEKYDAAGISYVNQKEWAALAALYARQNFRRLWCLQEMVIPDSIVMYLGPHEIPWDEFMMVTEQLYILQSKFHVPPSSQFRSVYTTAIEREAHLISELRMRRRLDESEAFRERFWSKTKRFFRGKGQPASIPLLSMLMMTITFQCSNPSDHIYGMLGMCGKHPESPGVTIDYRKPFEQLYAEIMKLYILQDGMDHPLSHIALIKDSENRERNSLPSWVLDFGQPGVASIAEQEYSADGELSFDKDSLKDAKWNELPVEGLLIDNIASMASHRRTKDTVSLVDFDPAWFSLLHEMPPEYITGQPRTEVLWRTLCLDRTSGYDYMVVRAANDSIASKVPAPDKYGEQFRQQLMAMLLAFGERRSAWQDKFRNTQGGVLLQALLGLKLQQEQGSSEVLSVHAPTAEEQASIKDMSLNGPNFADDNVQTALALIDQIVAEDGKDCQIPSRADFEAFLANPTYRIWRDPGEAVPHDTQIADYLPPGQDDFRTLFLTYNGGRRLFLTSRGYLGLGPMTMRQDDEVWIVKGSRCPFLLRKKTDVEGPRYQYVGDIYVHGIMQGEGLSLAEEFENIILV